jgi:hypothetical protein
LLGNKTTLVTYTGMAIREGTIVEVTIHIASVKDGDEYVTVVSTARSGSTVERVLRLIHTVKHHESAS